MLYFPERLKWLREGKKLTQKEMSELIGVSQQYYNKFERGTGQPNLETLFKIRHILGESLDFIIGYELEDMKASQLYGIYAESRRRLEESIDDLAFYEEMMNSSGRDTENILKHIKQSRDEIKALRNKEEKAFDMFYEHLKTIPMVPEEFSSREYWIEKYPSYVENDNKIYHDFITGLDNL